MFFFFASGHRPLVIWVSSSVLIVPRERVMNGIRRLVGSLVVVALAAFSLPGIAAKGGTSTDKAYSLVVEAQPIYSGTPATIEAPVKVLAKFKNLAPPSSASSNPGSLELRITNPGVTFYVDDTHEPFGTVGENGPASGTAVKVSDTRIVVTNMSPLKGGQTYFLYVWVTSCGDARYDSTVYTGSSLSGDTFKRLNDASDLSNVTTLISCGTLACGDEVSIAVADTASRSPQLFVKHGLFNKDGSCGPSAFYVSNKLLSDNNQVHFRWPVNGTGAQASAAFAYEVISLDATVPRVGWLNSDGSPATDAITSKQAAYIDGSLVPCSSGDLPAPYGTLSNNANSSTLKLKVDTSTGAVAPPPVPFVIIIGSERMKVINVQNTQWTVEARGAGGTAPDGHLAGAKVMSTPLPLLPTTPFNATLADGTVLDAPTYPAKPFPYEGGKQAQMCVVGARAPVVPATDPPTWSTTIIDIGDGWVRIGQ
jgi:hypothetical protein